MIAVRIQCRSFFILLLYLLYEIGRMIFMTWNPVQDFL
ncbi:Hypothetical protein Minf_1191 [Methylacidiphilum infernorum V4]|uniref:Uncharacterized protein n=1 Tax=Methylacidiphilum infernorum (isolate V4) TaxID=481448 RepID=B3DV93_METI4|nr:Hypothetical protein Minf_1191 [Methylacidiphilum infernorum V4]